MKTHAPIHPGEVLSEDFLIPLGLSEYRVAKDIGVPPRRINEIVKGRRALTVDTALRLNGISVGRLKCGSICKSTTTSSSPRNP